MKKSPCEIVQRTCGRGTSAGATLTPGNEWLRWRTRAAINNRKAANDEAVHAWRIAA